MRYAIICQRGNGYSLCLANNHEQEHPEAAAYCDDRGSTDGLCPGEGDASRRARVGRGLPPTRPPGARRDHPGPDGGSVAYSVEREARRIDGHEAKDDSVARPSRGFHMAENGGTGEGGLHQMRRPAPSASLRRCNASRAASPGLPDALSRAMASGSMTSTPLKPLILVRVDLPHPFGRGGRTDPVRVDHFVERPTRLGLRSSSRQRPRSSAALS